MTRASEEGFYTTGQFAKKADVTVRTLRWYDKEGVLKPSAHTASNARLYTDQDLAKLQQILLFKYLGFSLEDIKEMIITGTDHMQESLEIQKKLIEEKIREMQSVKEILIETEQSLKEHDKADWSALLQALHASDVEQSMKEQYRTAANISARIRLHEQYSVNKQGWFPWVFEQCHIREDMRILEIGCGNGQLWKENLQILPGNVHIILSDASEGMIQNVHESFQNDGRFICRTFPGEEIPYSDRTFDLVIANHMLFYCDTDKVLSEVKRVLKKDGTFICSTYSSRHMKEIRELVQGFDEDIYLSKDNLYEKFGLENGNRILSSYFTSITCRKYEDEIYIEEPEPLIQYILSCHGNQNSLILDHYHEFYEYVKSIVKDGFHITKDAGLFICMENAERLYLHN